MSKPFGGTLVELMESSSTGKEVPMELPAQLKANRERLGLSQEDVAKKIYVSRQTISNWETGKTYPDIQSLLLLSSLFGVSIDELVKGDVDAMKEHISNDARTLKRLSGAMAASIAGAIVAGCLMIILRDMGPATGYGMSAGSFVALISAGVLFLCAFAFAVWSEVLKKQNNLVTYREILAFENGELSDGARDENSFSRRHPVLSVMLKVLIGAFVVLIALVFFEIVAKLIRDFIFIG